MQFARMMGIVPLGIGLTVLGFLWTQPFGGFGSLPLFFRVFGSFIALGFIMVGAALLSGKLTDPNRLKQMADQLRSQLPEQPRPDAGEQVGYQCASCGAPLAKDVEVSPQGDVKCAHCDRWFNIYGRS